MTRFILQLIYGHMRKHRLEALLCLIGVAVGVSVVVSIDAAVNACVQSFSGAVDSLAQRSTHSIFSSTGGVTDQQYIDLVRRKFRFPLAPMIDRGVLIDGKNEESITARLIGVDVFSEKSFRSFTQMQSALDGDAFAKFITQPGQVVLVRSLADRVGASVGSSIEMTVGQGKRAVQVVGIVNPTGVAASQLDDVIIADLATAQELCGQQGNLDRIDTYLENAADAEELAAQLPGGLVLRSTQQQAGTLAQTIQSYRLNLTALSLMASFVAVFIVYNSMLISVQQRSKSLGILRCLGASRWQLGSLYFSEAIAFAVVGGVIGVVGGWGLSRLLVGYIATTINDLYAGVKPLPVELSASMWIEGMATAIGSCVAGAILPLLQAARTPPVNAFRISDRLRGSGKMSVINLVGGASLLGIAYLVFLVPGNSPVAGFVMAFLVAVGFALVCPGMVSVMCALVGKVARLLQLVWLQMAGSTVVRSLGITGVAVAATMLAMAMNIGIRTMVSSFRTSLDIWMNQRFAADIFLGPELLLNHKIDATLDPQVLAWVKSQPEAGHINAYRSIDVEIGGKSTVLTGTDVGSVLVTLPIKQRLAAKGDFDPKQDALISEPLAGRLHALAGDWIVVGSPTGAHRFHVYCVFYDFGTERGQMMLDRSTFAADWQDEQINSLQIQLIDPSQRREVARRWSSELGRKYPVVVDSFDGVKTEAMTVFDRTFKVTVVLTWLSGAVAFCGLAGSLLALALARQRDYSLLTAIGMSGPQLNGWVLGQGIIIALASAIVAPVAGTVLAYVLAYVIQYRSFGWSIPTTPQPIFWVENLLLAMAAAAVAAIYPIYRLRANPPAGGLRLE